VTSRDLSISRPVAGARVIELERHTDPRGSLVAFTEAAAVPFTVRHAYFIVDCPSDAVRAEHAQSCEELLVAVSGAVTVDLDTGRERASVRLDGPEQALHVSAGVWLRLRDFSDDAALAVLASQVYEEMTHSDAPRSSPAPGRS
jgi:dTDP-4-dehydrorhamnose 3,5-epimerase-like enzyme